jgi:hypothetical protein
VPASSSLIRSGALACLVLMVAAPAGAPAASAPPAGASAALPAEQQQILEAWYGAVGPRRPGESVGALAVRAGLAQLGKPYYNPPPSAEPETLRVELRTFQCVSFVESTLSLARCVLAGSPTAACFAHELQAFRYRGGTINGFSSRMHYFSDWLLDNEQRGRLQLVTEELGGKRLSPKFFFMSTHASRYPALADAAELASITSLEARLSSMPTFVIDRDQVARAERQLQTGDVLAIVGDDDPGLLITHTALVFRDARGVPHVLHASSQHHQVLLTTGDVANYITRWPHRQGLLVARPLAPAAALQASSTDGAP